MTGPKRCDPSEAGLKSFFLGPQAENGPWVTAEAARLFERWCEWRRSLFPEDGKAITEGDQALPDFAARRERFRESLAELVRRFEGEIPKFSPRYAGHMFSEISLPALFGHFVALLHNPNNVSGESSRVGIAIEREAVAELARMVGMSPESTAGHFTAGGTISNFEGVIRARSRLDLWLSAGAWAAAAGRGRETPFQAAQMGWGRFDEIAAMAGPGAFDRFSAAKTDPVTAARRCSEAFGAECRGPLMLVPRSKHYSWPKAALTLGLGLDSVREIELDRDGHLSVGALLDSLAAAEREGRPVLLVATVAGTTELGEIDPVDRVQDEIDRLARDRGIHLWHHVDAAYGGFFCTLLRGGEGGTALGPVSERALQAVARASSVTLDPHKLGYVPFASGAFLARNRREYAIPAAPAPYLSLREGVDPGPFTLEGSRSAAGAAATWLTARSIGLDREGYGRILERTIRVRAKLASALVASGPEFRIVPHADTNILCFHVARQGERLSSSNARTLRLYEAFSPRGEGPFMVSRTLLGEEAYGAFIDAFAAGWGAVRDVGEVALVRLCLLNPFFDSVETGTDFVREFASRATHAVSAGRL